MNSTLKTHHFVMKMYDRNKNLSNFFLIVEVNRFAGFYKGQYFTFFPVIWLTFYFVEKKIKIFGYITFIIVLL